MSRSNYFLSEGGRAVVRHGPHEYQYNRSEVEVWRRENVWRGDGEWSGATVA